MEKRANYESAANVLGTDENDSIKNYGAYATVEGGAGNDTIINDKDTMIGLRNDNGLIRYESFEVRGVYSSISGGAGVDRLLDKVGYSILNGGAGNDQITLGAFSTLEYGAGDGNDTVYGYNGRNAIHITSGSYATTKSGNDLVLKVGNNSLTLKNAYGLNQNIAVGDEALRPTYEDIYVRQIFGTEGDDTLYVDKEDMTVEAYEGDDVIINNTNVGARSMLIGSLGNDTLVSNSPEITVAGGKGDDVIELSGVNQTVRYHSGEGDDTVVGYQSGDVIHLIDGADYETVANDFDVVISLKGGSITLLDAVDTELNIDTTRDDEDYVEEFKWEIATPEHDKIAYNRKKGIITVANGFNGAVDAANFNDAVSQINAASVSASVDLRGGTRGVAMYASKGGSTLRGGEGNDKMYGGAGEDIFVYNVGGGQDVVGVKTKDANNFYQARDGVVVVSDEHYGFDDVSIKDNKSGIVMTFNGDKKSKLTVNRTDVDTPIKFYFGSSAEAALANGYITYGELPEGVRYMEKKNGELDYTRLTVDETVDGESINAAAINSQIVTVDGSNAAGWLELYGNDKNNVLKVGLSGGVLYGGAGNDQLYGSTEPDVYDSYVFKMQPKGKKDVIRNYDEIDDIVIDTSLLEEDFPEFDEEHGVITYEGAKENFNGFNDSKDDVVVTLNKKNTLTIKNGAGKAINFFDETGNLLGTFGHTLPAGLAYDKKRTGIFVADVENAGTEGDLDIDLSNEENIYYASAVNVDMTGLEGNASLTGNAKNNILKAGDLYTQMRGGAGNDQLYGSTAEDANVDYIYSAGKDVIYNYDPDDDYVYISGETAIDYDVLATVTSKNFVEKGNDVILNLDKNNSITFKDGVGKVIEVFDDNGALDEYTGVVRYDFSLPNGLKYNSTKRTEIAVEDSDTAIEQGYLNIDLSNETNEEAFEFASTVKKIDLSAITDPDFRAGLIGNAQNNEIYGASAGYNELYGGHREFDNPKKAKPSVDKLYGSEGADDVFIYGVGDGKDVVINYGAYDVVRLDDTYGEIETVVLTDRKNVVTIELNGDKNNVLTVNKDDINRPLVLENFYGTVNGLDNWYGMGDFGLVYGVDANNMTLSADGTKLSIGGEYLRYIYADAREINSQLKTMDARDAEADVVVEMTGNGNNNALYAGAGGSILDGGRDSVKLKATSDALYGNEGADTFVYRFEDGLGGKDSVVGFDATTDNLYFDVAPTKVTANGTNLTFTFEDNIDGKKYSGTLIVNGASKITSLTGVTIDIAGDEAVYNFDSKLRNAAWDSEGITVERGNIAVVTDGTVEALPTAGNTAEQWTMLDEKSYAYDYAGVEFTVSGSAVRDWAPDNNFERGAVIDLIVSDGIPDGIMVDAKNKTIVLSDQFDESTARFTFGNDESVEDYSWKKYITMVPTIEYELPTEDYWFEGGAIDESPLNEIVSTEAALDLSTEFLPPARPCQFATADIVGGSARRHQK